MEIAVPYEEKLKRDFAWALREGSMHFEEESGVYDSLMRIVKRLDLLPVPHAIVGGMALFLHGYRRFTEDVDILVTKAGLRAIHENLEGLGYVAPFTGSKNLRDANTGVRIEFLVTGDFPGDGRPKPVAFPDPEAVSTTIHGMKVLRLSTLVELKLASGTAPGRLKDLADVQELIRAKGLDEAFAQELNESVRAQYLKLWSELKSLPPPE